MTMICYPNDPGHSACGEGPPGAGRSRFILNHNTHWCLYLLMYSLGESQSLEGKGCLDYYYILFMIMLYQ